MGVAVAGGGIQPHLVERIDHPAILGFPIILAVNFQPFGDDLPHGHARAEAAERILEHHLYLPA